MNNAKLWILYGYGLLDFCRDTQDLCGSFFTEDTSISLLKPKVDGLINVENVT